MDVSAASTATCARCASAPASAQTSAAAEPEPAPALLPLLRPVRRGVLGVDHGLETVSRTMGRREGSARVSASRVETNDRRDLRRAGRLGTHNAAMRFTTLQNVSVTMLSRYGERRLTTAPSRTYGMPPSSTRTARSTKCFTKGKEAGEVVVRKLK